MSTVNMTPISVVLTAAHKCTCLRDMGVRIFCIITRRSSPSSVHPQTSDQRLLPEAAAGAKTVGPHDPHLVSSVLQQTREKEFKLVQRRLNVGLESPSSKRIPSQQLPQRYPQQPEASGPAARETSLYFRMVIV